jgi:hypothetical protein
MYAKEPIRSYRYCYYCYYCYRRIVQKRRGCFHTVHHRSRSVPRHHRSRSAPHHHRSRSAPHHHRSHSVPHHPWTYTLQDPKNPKSQKSGPEGHGC